MNQAHHLAELQKGYGDGDAESLLQAIIEYS